ncbi:MAG: efflux RND transporter periplasmic adaptor subunit [Gammaproteobacteria bacterium]|nr:efflux RND transporter periplasmic adaptor subunit [Gammaproteobacteria bacterium]
MLPALSYAAPPKQTKSSPVIISEVKVDRFVDRVEALGTLKANESVSVTANVTETVANIHFDDGQRVDAGDVLVELTSAEERALLKEARVRESEATRQYERIKSLVAQRSASQSLLDERTRDLDAARAIRVAIESRLSDRMIKAPFAGVLGLRNISRGSLVEPGDVITTLDDDSVMKLDFTVPSIFLPRLKIGLGIEAKASAYGNRSFEGEIHSINSRVDPVTRSIQVRAYIPNPDRTLKPGVLMQVEMLKNPREAIVVPESALLQRGREHYVMMVNNDNVAERRQVTIGGRRPGEVEIVAGLTQGDRVITHGNDKVRPGQPVTIQAVEDGTKSLQQMLGATQ